MDELLADAEEALACYVVEELEHSGKLPKSSDIKAIATEDKDFSTLIRIDADLASRQNPSKRR